MSNFYSDCTAVILAGGLSQRMGQDKAWLHFQGEALLPRAIALLTPLFPEVVLSVRQHRTEFTLRQIIDQEIGCGPLMGLYTALSQITTEWIWVQAMDMPFLTPEAIQTLAKIRNNQHAVLPNIHNQIQPLAGFYARNCLPVLLKNIQQQQLSIKRALSELNVSYLSTEHFSTKELFIDLDTQEDVARVSHLFTKTSQ